MIARAIPLKIDSMTFRNCARAGSGAVSTIGPPEATAALLFSSIRSNRRFEMRHEARPTTDKAFVDHGSDREASPSFDHLRSCSSCAVEVADLIPRKFQRRRDYQASLGLLPLGHLRFLPRRRENAPWLRLNREGAELVDGKESLSGPSLDRIKRTWASFSE